MLTQDLTVERSQEEQNKALEVWLWHHQLGHASFSYLQRFFPSLFVKNDVSSFKCGVCELAKSHRTSFLSSLTKSFVPFIKSILMFEDHLKLLHLVKLIGSLLLLMISHE